MIVKHTNATDARSMERLGKIFKRLVAETSNQADAISFKLSALGTKCEELAKKLPSLFSQVQVEAVQNDATTSDIHTVTEWMKDARKHFNKCAKLIDEAHSEISNLR